MAMIESAAQAALFLYVHQKRFEYVFFLDCFALLAMTGDKREVF